MTRTMLLKFLRELSLGYCLLSLVALGIMLVHGEPSFHFNRPLGGGIWMIAILRHLPYKGWGKFWLGLGVPILVAWLWLAFFPQGLMVSHVQLIWLSLAYLVAGGLCHVYLQKGRKNND
ncbi:hypothetical protein ACVRZR_08905 [Streptococcus entericus]|uniref:hypothetical protein n=1 Tax=Streptococcus entericus TaxID=155680 RepID=UPI0003703594|nr:hypothetical protein [Streptococcus entericus]